MTWPEGWDHDLGGVFNHRARRELPRYQRIDNCLTRMECSDAVLSLPAVVGEDFRSSECRRDPVFFKRNTTVQVWTIGERFGIGSEFSLTCCPVNNFRDHDLTSPLNSRPLPDPTHALWIGSDISPI